MSLLSTTKKIAEYVSSLAFKDIPNDVIDHLKLCLVDTIGCGLYGSRLPWGQKIINAIQSISGENVSTGASVFGQRKKFSPDHAALINGTLIHSFEFDDLHKTAVIHPGAEVIPVLLALSEYMENNGEVITAEQFLTALAAGYEVGCQIGMVTGSEQLQRGFHPSATSGVFGATAAGAKLLNLSMDETLHALGIAGTQASGLMSAQYEAMVKRMNPGKSAQSGLLSVLLAREGFTGITNVLEAEYGGFAKVFADRSFELNELNDLGNTYETLNVGFKPYPCCGSNHTAIDSILEINKEMNGPFTVDMIDQVEIETTTATKHHVGWDYQPSGTIAAQMNLQYAIAVTLLDGACTIHQYNEDRIVAPDVMDLIKKIKVTINKNFDALGREGRHHIRLKITFSNGRIITKEKRHAKGSMQFPLTKKEVENKFIDLANTIFSLTEAKQKLEDIKSIGKVKNIREFLDKVIIYS